MLADGVTNIGSLSPQLLNTQDATFVAKLRAQAKEVGIL